jgi:hypothetical protein
MVVDTKLGSPFGALTRVFLGTLLPPYPHPPLASSTVVLVDLLAGEPPVLKNYFSIKKHSSDLPSLSPIKIGTPELEKNTKLISELWFFHSGLGIFRAHNQSKVVYFL